MIDTQTGSSNSHRQNRKHNTRQLATSHQQLPSTAHTKRAPAPRLDWATQGLKTLCLQTGGQPPQQGPCILVHSRPLPPSFATTAGPLLKSSPLMLGATPSYAGQVIGSICFCCGAVPGREAGNPEPLRRIMTCQAERGLCCKCETEG